MKEFAFETGLFDKPAGVDFIAVFAMVDGVAFVGGGLGCFFGEINIMEERASAGDFEWIGEFVGAKLCDDATDALRVKIGETMLGDVFFDGIIERAWHGALL